MGRWDTGIQLDGIWFPQLRGCAVSTRHPGTDADTNYEAGAGIHLSNCFFPHVEGCFSLGRFLHNLWITETGEFGYEDFSVIGGQYVGARYGITVNMQSAAEQAELLKEPGGRIMGAHINGHEYGVGVFDRRDASVIGNHIYTTIGSGKHEYAEEAFIRVHDSQNVFVRDNLLAEGGFYTNDTDCSRGVYITGSSDGITVQGNTHNHDGIAIYNTATGASQVGPQFYDGYNAPSNSGVTKKLHTTAGSVAIDGVSRDFSPVLVFDGTSTGITYSTQTGSYTRHGNLITANISITLTSKGTDTGTAQIETGLPAPKSGAEYSADVSFTSGMTTAVRRARVGTLGNIQLYTIDAPGNSVVASEAAFSGTDILQLSWTYEVE